MKNIILTKWITNAVRLEFFDIFSHIIGSQLDKSRSKDIWKMIDMCLESYFTIDNTRIWKAIQEKVQLRIKNFSLWLKIRPFTKLRNCTMYIIEWYDVLRNMFHWILPRTQFRHSRKLIILNEKTKFWCRVHVPFPNWFTFSFEGL